MNMFEEQLWDYYQTICTQERNEEKKELLDELLENEDALLETFTEEQTALFFRYNDSVGEYHSMNEQEAFINGVRLTSAFFVDIVKMLYNNPFIRW